MTTAHSPATARAVVLHEFGAPEVMKIETVPLGSPDAGQVQIRQTAIGFNFLDMNQRRGAHPLPLPTGLGLEGAGIVESVGAGVVDLRVGDRVAYINAGLGAYADRRNVPADKLVTIPPGVSDAQAATLLFKGLTAQYLIMKTHPVAKGDLILVHAAAGGVGQILCRWAKALGAIVAGTVGSAEKEKAAKAAGCDIVIDYSHTDWPDRFLAATGGRKARVVYESVGQATFEKSLDCVVPFGLVVVFGASSGRVQPVDPELLNRKGCLFMTRPSVFPHNATTAALRENAAALFQAVMDGHVRVEIGARFPLDRIVDVHRAVEARQTTGAVLITP